MVAFFGFWYVNCVTNLQETNSKKVKDYRKNANEFHTMLAWSTASVFFFSLSIKIADSFPVISLLNMTDAGYSARTVL